jgi:hypothetical protein
MHAAQKILEKTQNEFQKTKFNMAYFLPFGKAYDTVIPSLPGFAVVYYSVTLGRLS